MLFAFLPGIHTLQAADPGVLHLKKNNYHSYLDLGVDLNKELLRNPDRGNGGDATLEFWVKSVQPGHGWELLDMSSDALHFSMAVSGDTLTLQVKGESHVIDLSGVTDPGAWYHAALVISDEGQQARVLINGQTYGVFNVDLSDEVGRKLYFYKARAAEIFLTEMRFWASRRTPQAIEENRWFPYVKKSTLTSERNAGLVALYADDTYTEESLHHLDALTDIHWVDFLNGDRAISAVNRYNENTLVSVDRDPTHPIMSNNRIFLTASKGNEPEASKDKVYLTWNPLQGATSYLITRTDPSTGETITFTQGGGNGVDLSREDENVVPGRLYRYEVEAPGLAGAAAGSDLGFIGYNGSLGGRVTSQVGGKPVDSVRVTAKPQVESGSALTFTSADQQIDVYTLDAFRQGEAFTLTFWYRSLTNTGSNGIFKLGTTEIRAEGNKMQVFKAGSLVMETVVPDTDWHHYAFVCAADGSILVDADINAPAVADLSSRPPGNVYAFQVNYETESEYRLDELRVWDWDLAAARANLPWYHDAYVAGDEPGLLISYRFDMQDSKKVFNLCIGSRGEAYTGETQGTLTRDPSSAGQAGLVYKGLTDANGDYHIPGIDHRQTTGVNYEVIPFKSIPAVEGKYEELYHTFYPATKTILLKYEQDKFSHQKTHDISDISQLPVSGFFYFDELGQQLPAPAGISMLIDLDAQLEDQFLSDINGNYLLYSALGDHTFKVNNPDNLSYSTGNQSLYFNGQKAWARVAAIPHREDNTGTWTGWVKKADAVNTRQTLLNIGNSLELALENNVHLAVNSLPNGTEILRVENAVSTGDWVFFSLTYDGLQVSLKAGNQETRTVAYNGFISGDELLLGIRAEEGEDLTSFTGYLDQLEYRDAVYDSVKIGKIRAGKLLPEDREHLQLSYAFTGADSVFRAISLTPAAHEKVMELYGAVKSQLAFKNHQKSYKTVYVPVNDDPALAADTAAASYTTTVLAPRSNLNFEITNRYGFTGYILTPCGFGAGEWKGTLSRTDLAVGYTFSKAIDVVNFNSDNTVFHADGLVPGAYKLTLVHQGNGRTLENLTPIVIDSADYVYEFDYKNPLEGASKLYAASASGEFDSLLSPLPCTAGIYELESGVTYALELSSFELYEGDTCMVEGIDYTISGDLGSENQYTGEIPEGGKRVVFFTAGSPNYSSPGTARTFNITLTRTGGIVEQYSATLQAYVTGSEMNDPNFTIVNPDIITVLHDPPGDNSSVTMKQGTTISRTISHSVTGGIEADFGVTFGNEFNNSVLVGGFGFGVINNLLKSRISVTLSTNIAHTEGGAWATTHAYGLDNSISTSSAGDIVGEDADVFIGRGQIMTVGQGRKVVVNNCIPELEVNREIVRFDYTTPFYYTATGIEAVLQEVLDQILEDPNSTEEEKTEAQAGYQQWSAILTENIERINAIDEAPSFTDAFFAGGEEVPDEDFSISGSDEFSFGGGLTINLAVNTTQTSGNTYNNSTKIGGGYASESDIAAFGFLARLKSKVDLSVAHTYSNAYTDERVSGYSITLSDDEPLDHFSVKWKMDPEYGTPMFSTFAGQSMCPYESGTENREGLEMIVDGSSDQLTTVGRQLDYQLRLTNTQLAQDNRLKSYTLALDNTSNTEGVTVLFNGNPFTEGQPFLLYKDSIATPVISVRSDQPLETELKLKFLSACEAAGGSLIYSMDKLQNAKLLASVFLTARFEAPCVEEIEVAAPVDNHVVVSASGNKIPFRFKLHNALEGLENIRIEYRIEGSSEANTLNVIELSTINEDVQGFYSYDVDVSTLQDKRNYTFRLSPECTSGTGEAGKSQVPSEWIAVRIDKEVPTIVAVTPEDNSQWISGPVSVTYSKPLSPVIPNNIVVDMVKDDELVENINKTIAINGNQLVIAPGFPDKDLEGSVLTVTIPEGEVKDSYGNPAAAYTWSFLVNKNKVSWTQANKQLTVPQGSGIGFTMSIKNEGVLESSYLIRSLPDWLTLPGIEEGIPYILYGQGYTAAVDFAVSSALDIGVYSHIVKAETPGGDESFRLEVTVTAASVTARVSVIEAEFGGKVVEAAETVDISAPTFTVYPNPLSDATTIGYLLPEASGVQVAIIDITGRQVRGLVNGYQEKGNHTLQWRRDNASGVSVPSGTYFVRIIAGKKTVSQTIIVR